MPEILDFRSVRDHPNEDRLKPIFEEYWPAYRRWMARAEPVPLSECRDALESAMPELVPTFERLLERFGPSDSVARFLTLYSPPRLVRACTQLVMDHEGEPALIRTYDHHPRLCDAIVLWSQWTDAPAIALTDCLWGALDGLNAKGLAVALAFGGRNARGPGFAAPLLTRYLLETCTTVADARDALQRVPVSMPYTFVIADASGEFLTAFAGPDRPARFVSRRASANHQTLDDWPEYFRQTQSVERLRAAESLLEADTTLEDAIEAFLHPPIWRSDYARGSGTLYVAVYHPSRGALSLHWPGATQRFTLTDFTERDFDIELPGS